MEVTSIGNVRKVYFIMGETGGSVWWEEGMSRRVLKK